MVVHKIPIIIQPCNDFLNFLPILHLFFLLVYASSSLLFASSLFIFYNFVFVSFVFFSTLSSSILFSFCSYSLSLFSPSLSSLFLQRLFSDIIAALAVKSIITLIIDVIISYTHAVSFLSILSVCSSTVKRSTFHFLLSSFFHF